MKKLAFLMMLSVLFASPLTRAQTPTPQYQPNMHATVAGSGSNQVTTLPGKLNASSVSVTNLSITGINTLLPSCLYAQSGVVGTTNAPCATVTGSTGSIQFNGTGQITAFTNLSMTVSPLSSCPTTVTFNGGAGSGAIAAPICNSAPNITGISVSYGGSYTVPPTVEFTGGGCTTTPGVPAFCQATAVLNSAGAVTGVTNIQQIIYGGVAGCPTTVVFSGGGGSGAQAAIVCGGVPQQMNISITNGGANYTSNALATITGGVCSDTGVTCTAVGLAGGNAASSATADVQGDITSPATITAKTMIATQNANQWQSGVGTNDGLAMSLNECATYSYACQVLAPALYAKTEPQPWGGAFQYGWSGSGQHTATNGYGPATSQPSGCITDQRFGGPQVICHNGVTSPSWGNNLGIAVGAGFFNYNTTNLNNSYNSVPSSLTLLQSNLWGTTYDVGQEQAQVLSLYQQNDAPASPQMIFAMSNQNSVGDNTLFSGTLINRGGTTLGGSEGSEVFRIEHSESPDVYQGTINSITYSSSGTANVCPTGPCYIFNTTKTQGTAGGLGDGLDVIDVSQEYNTGYIALMTNYSPSSGVNGQYVTGSGTNWDSTFGDSAAHTTTTSQVNLVNFDPSRPNTNQVIPVVSATGFTAGGNACMIATGGSNWENEPITAVDTVHNTITVSVLRNTLGSGAIVSEGGMSCMGFEMTADDVNNTQFNAWGYGPAYFTIVGTIRSLWRIAYNVSGDKAYITPSDESGYAFPGSGTRAFTQMGSGGSVSCTLSGGAITGCTASGGTGYAYYKTTSSTISSPQLSISGLSGCSTQPSIYISATTSGGALSTVGIANAGVGCTGTPSVTVTPENGYAVFPAAKALNVYNPSVTVTNQVNIGAVDGTSIATDMPAGTFNTGDTLEQEHYPTENYHMHSEVETAIVAGATMVGRYEQVGGHVVGPYGYNQWINQNQSYMYSGYPLGTPWVLGDGRWTAPVWYGISGAFSNLFAIESYPFGQGYENDTGLIAIGCIDKASGANVCSSTGNVPMFTLENSTNYADSWGYSPSTSTWTWTAGAGSAGGTQTFVFSPTGLTLNGGTISPWIDMSLSNDYYLLGVWTSNSTVGADSLTIKFTTTNGHIANSAIQELKIMQASGTTLATNGAQLWTTGAPGAIANAKVVNVSANVWDVYVSTYATNGAYQAAVTHSGETWTDSQTVAQDPGTGTGIYAAQNYAVKTVDNGSLNAWSNAPATYGIVNQLAVANPGSTPAILLAASTAAGSCAAATYYYNYYYTTGLTSSSSHTLAGGEGSVTLSGTGQVFVNLPTVPPDGAMGWVPEVGTSSGTEIPLSTTPLPITQSRYVDTTCTGTGSTPSANTTQGGAEVNSLSAYGPPYYSAGGGTAQAQTGTPTVTPPSLTAGLVVRWLPTAANTAANPTLAWAGLAAKTVKKCGGSALVANDLVTTAIATAVYDGTYWELQNPAAVGCTPASNQAGSGSYVPTLASNSVTSADLVDFDGTGGEQQDSGIASGKVLANCGTLTTTAGASDSLSCTWVTSSSTCHAMATNSTAAGLTGVYAVPGAGSVVVYHSATASGTFGVACSAN